MMWVAPKSWPSNSSENGTSSSPMKQAARTAKACSESSIFIASLVVTGSPPIDCATVLMFGSLVRPFKSPVACRSIGGPRRGPVRVRIARPAIHRLLEDARPVELVLGPVQDHRIAVDARHGLLVDLEVGDEGAVFMVGEVEDPVVELLEAAALHDLPQAVLRMQVDLGVALLARELLGPLAKRHEQAHRAVALQDDGALELGEGAEPADADRRGGLAVDVEHRSE